MKKIAVLFTLVFIFGVCKSEAQILKGLGKKIEKKLEERIDRKADKSVDKVLDKADREIDKPIDNVLNNSSNRAAEKNTDVKPPNAQGEQVVAQSPSNNTVALSEGLVIMSGGDCADFIWFKPGAMMEFETTDGNGGTLNKSRMEISKVYNEGQVTVADAMTSDNEGNSF